MCNDNHKKTVKRIFDFKDEVIEFELCEICKLDPDFLGFISESKINEDSKNWILNY